MTANEFLEIATEVLEKNGMLGDSDIAWKIMIGGAIGLGLAVVGSILLMLVLSWYIKVYCKNDVEKMAEFVEELNKNEDANLPTTYYSILGTGLLLVLVLSISSVVLYITDFKPTITNILKAVKPVDVYDYLTIKDTETVYEVDQYLNPSYLEGVKNGDTISISVDGEDKEITYNILFSREYSEYPFVTLVDKKITGTLEPLTTLLEQEGYSIDFDSLTYEDSKPTLKKIAIPKYYSTQSDTVINQNINIDSDNDIRVDINSTVEGGDE